MTNRESIDNKTNSKNIIKKIFFTISSYISSKYNKYTVSIVWFLIYIRFYIHSYMMIWWILVEKVWKIKAKVITPVIIEALGTVACKLEKWQIPEIS